MFKVSNLVLSVNSLSINLVFEESHTTILSPIANNLSTSNSNGKRMFGV